MLRNFVSFFKLRPVFSVAFLLCCTSLLFGIWVAAIPGIKDRLGFTDGTLGLSLLLSPLGALTGVGLSGIVFRKMPVGRWMIIGYVLLSIIMIGQINAANRIMFWACLYLFGLTSFLNGVSVNTTINMYEKKYNRRFMSTSHALYSVGGGISAGIATVFFSFGIRSVWQIVIMAGCVFLILLINRKYLLSHNEIIHSRSGLRLPSVGVLSISFICMILFMTEGCVADWSAIYLKETLHASKQFIPLGYAGFASAMTIGRLNGDQLVTRFGSKSIVAAGSALAAAGFLVVVTSPIVIPAIIGYIMVGFGCCCIVPVLFSASGKIPGIGAVEGYAMVTTGGLIGFLTGPSIIGLISEKINLSVALSLLILLLAIVSFTAGKNNLLENRKLTATTIEYDEQLY
jgi:MFS family permease